MALFMPMLAGKASRAICGKTDRVPEMTAEQAATTVVQTLRDAGHIAYFAGGCVRDRLMGLPAKDFDVATDAKPDRVQQLFRKTQAVGAAFGVILVRLGGQMIEVATFRSDGKYEDGRRPETVTFDTAESDAQRRDFTINGLFYDPFEQKIIDYVGGQADLASKTLRAIGKPAERFAEDHLRLLRAVRFAARFGLTIEPETAAAMNAAAPMLAKISAERIADELRRILTAPSRDLGYELLWRHRLIPPLQLCALIKGDIVDYPAAEPPGSFFETHSARSIFLNLEGPKGISFSLACLALLLDVAREGEPNSDVRSLLAQPNAWTALARKKLKLSNDELDAIGDIARQVHGVLATPSPDDAKLKRLLARPTAASCRLLLEAIASIGQHVEAITAVRPRLEALAKTDVAPTPLLNGDQLIAAGATPGPAFKSILDRVYDAQLNGDIASESEALRMGLTLVQRGAMH